MIANWSRNADTTRRALGLESRSYVDRVTVQVSPIGNRIAYVDSHAEADGSIRGQVAVMHRNLLLHFHGTAHGSVDAVEHNKEGVTASLDDPAAVLLDRGIDQVLAQSPEPVERPLIIQADQTAVTHHIGMHHRDQLPPIWRSSGRF
jgi:hypothetical protein